MEVNGIIYKNEAENHQEILEEALSQIIDTEIGLDVVNLGLIYEVDLDQEGHCTIRLTFTSAGCPCAQDILDGIHLHVGALDFVQSIENIIVWHPAWELTRITRLGRIALGINPGRKK